MDLLLSVALLALFIVAVDVTLGSDAAGPAGRLSLLFASPDQLGWPRGVQESYERLSVSWTRAATSAAVMALAYGESQWPAPEIVEEGIAPVRVSRVR